MTDADKTREAQIRHRMRSWYDGFADAPVVQARDDCRALLRLLDEARAETEAWRSAAAQHQAERNETYGKFHAAEEEIVALKADVARLTVELAQANESRDSWHQNCLSEQSRAIAAEREAARLRDGDEHTHVPSYVAGVCAATLTASLGAPTDEDLSALIKPVWLEVKPDRAAQAIRSSLSVAFDDPRWKQWVSDFIPHYVWDLVDIAAQRGINTATAPPGASAMERATSLYFSTRFPAGERDHIPYENRDEIARAIEQAEREAGAAAIELVRRRLRMFIVGAEAGTIPNRAATGRDILSALEADYEIRALAVNRL